MTPTRQINPWLIAVSVMFATFMEVLDTTVVNVSLPHIAGSLSSTIEEATWALTSYLVANAIVLPMTGWLASFIGRKRLLMVSVVGFTASSFLCGLAPTLSSLIVFRNGAVIDSGANSASVAEKLDSTMIDFRSGPTYHFTWTKDGPDAWTARLFAKQADGTERVTTYPMKRIRR